MTGRSNGVVIEMLPASPVPEPLIFPVSSSQRRCWFIDALRPGSTILNIALRWELKGRFSPAIVERAFQAVIDRHEILRTRFHERGGEPVQEVMPELRFKLSQVDLTMVPEAARAEEALALARREARVPFQLDRLPLIRVTLIRVGPEDAALLVTVHQIAFDGTSIGLLAREFGLAAEALQAGTAPALPELPMQYGDYARWQKAMFASRGFAAETDYWRRQLADAPYFEVASDLPRPETPSARSEIIAQMLPPALGAALEAAARAERVTLFSLGYAAVAAMLHRFTGETDIVIGTQLASRHHPDLEPLIGVFLNNLVLRVDAAGDPRLRDFMARANGVVQDALIHQQMPFDHLVELLNPPRDPSRTPLISINFAVLHEVLREASYGQFDLRAQPSLSPGSLYELNFFLVHWPTGWRLAVEYNTDLFARETAESLLAGWRTALDQILERADAPLSALPVAARRPADTAPTEDLAAIEEALLGDPLVAEAVAVAVPAGAEGTSYAYVVPAPRVRQPLETLPGTLMGNLARNPGLRSPPSGVSVLLALPRTAAGALDRRALPPPPRLSPPMPASEAAPSALEATIAAIWAEVLGVPSVRLDANFFDLGGHSLLAVRMCIQVGRRLGRQVEVVSLFRAPTLAAFARYVASLTEEAEDERIVAIQPHGTATPIFAINHSFAYVDAARRLGSDRPFYSVQALAATQEMPEPVRSFEEIAADYVALIRRARPTGPYILHGICVHGALAYEVARQLREDGETVELLVLMNTWHPAYMRQRSAREIWTIRLTDLRDNFQTYHSGGKTFAEFLATYSLVHKLKVLELARKLRLIEAVPPRTGSKTADGFIRYLLAARSRYRPQPYDGPVLQIVTANLRRGAGFEPTLGWSGTMPLPFVVRDMLGPVGAVFEDPRIEALAVETCAALTEAGVAEHALP